ncbi:MAG TPA: hypothetical protein VGO47_04650, partial [Chlamydiales bacterium]|nr:hypothetical protein [Chlamydiales bacterium]
MSEDVWINAQLGMMKIARDICQRHKHIKIFVSIRSEAFNNLEAQTSLQYQNISSILTYTKTQIQEIFEQNIAITEKQKLARADAVDSIERFVGFSKMDHRFVRDNGRPRKEETFDFIYRHTFGRPREIVLMGSKIEEISPRERNRDNEAVREVVNSVGGDVLLQQLKREIIPYFESEVFNKFCELVGSNVISTEQAKIISAEISDGMGFQGDVFSYLYSIGLVGTTEWNFRRNQFAQKFLPVGHYSLSANIPPKASKYFVIHSAVDKTLRDIHGRHFYNDNNIIGNELVFHEPESQTVDKSQKILHTHFGLGRDSLTLIIPELNQSKAIAVIQKPSRENHELSKVGFVEIRTGRYEPIKFAVIHDRFTESEINEAVSQWENGENILIYSDNHQILGRIINLSETITLWSSNLFAKPQEVDLLPQRALDEIGAETKGKVIYLCQRVINKKILTALRSQIRASGLDCNLCIESSLIDRLEYETTRSEENRTLIYFVEAEEYGSIISRARPGSKNEPSKIVRRTTDAKEQAFYEDRQKYLTEGIYRLAKLVKKVSMDRTIQNLDEIYELFFDIQISNLTSKHRLSEIYGNKSGAEIMGILMDFCRKHKERFVNLKKFPAFLGSQAQYTQDAKRMGAFPDSKTFFQRARQSSLFPKSQVVRELQKLLAIKDLPNYYSVFICFSAKDESFAKMISDSLKKRGVDTYFFKEDHRHGQIKSVEQKEIALRDKILFIASENSITSDEC